MVGQVFVEFRGSCSDFGKVVPWAGREVVMLSMVSKIQVENVPNSEIVVCLQSLSKLVVLSQDMNCGWVRANRKPGSDQKVEKSVPSPEVPDGIVGDDNHNKINDF